MSRVRVRSQSVLAVAFWLWAAFIAIGAGFIGSALNCESDEGCKPGSPSWLRPWTWGDFYVYPEAMIVGLAALVPGTAFVVFVVTDRRLPAAAALLPCLVLLGYPYFAGLTTSGRTTFGFGPLLGFAAIYVMRRSRSRLADP